MAVRLIEGPIDVEQVKEEVSSLDIGATVIFIGTVRETENGKPISAIRYGAYRTMAEKRLQKIVDTALELWGAHVAIHHRVGEVPVSEASVVIAASAPHRREAFAACQHAIDQIKEHVPIWKTEYVEAVPCPSK